MATTSNGKPTSRQLSYLKSLADRTGQTFTYPQTSRQASAEINRLKQTKPSSRAERYVERKLIADQIATGPLDAARVRDDEIHGRGSSATWMHNREQEPPPVEDPGPAISRRRRASVVGKRTELARYTVTEGERILYGQRIDGIVRVTDRPASEGGRSYLVERGLETKSELDALIGDYLLCRVRHRRYYAEALVMPSGDWDWLWAAVDPDCCRHISCFIGWGFRVDGRETVRVSGRFRLCLA